MGASSLWPVIHAERKALIADVEQLSPEQWSTPSLCSGWSVRDVVAHLAATAKMSPVGFVARLIGSGLRFDEMAARNIARETTGPPVETLASLRGALTATTHPPGPIETWLGETIVHSEDIRRPLGIVHDYPVAAVTRVADFYKGSNLLLHSKRRIAGLRLRATDAPWTTGTGPEVTGPVLSLVLAMTGRRAALEDLSGSGLEVLHGRV